MRLRGPLPERRSAAIAVELAVVLPLLMFLAAVGVDYARIFARALILETASRNACIYAAQNPTYAADKTGIETVARKDLTDVGDTTTVTSGTYTGADGNPYVKVTVSMTFTTIANFPGVPSSSNLSRSTDMRVNPTGPKPGTY